MSSEFTYRSIEVVQRPGAKPFYLVNAVASEILQWASVPRKKQEFQVGYQRQLDDRHEKIKDYFDRDEGNVIPSAVLIAANDDIEIRDVVATGPDGAPVVVEGVKDVVLRVREDLSDEELLQLAYDSLRSRLNADEKAFLDAPERSFEAVGDDEDTDEDSPAPPDSYVAIIAKEFKQEIEVPGSLPPGRREVLLDYAKTLRAPGMILDGQHRVYGAKLVNKYDVRVPVVLMTGTELAEQAFHFYIVNNKAKPLTPTELRGTISTSLTAKEIDDLYERFKQAGVSADTARWTHLLNTEADSPFVGLIDFGFGSGFLKENAMFQVVSKFMRPKRGHKSIFDGVDAWGEDSYRLELFYAFWSKIKERYPAAWDEAIKDQRGQLLFKATMLVLQGYVFDQFASEMPKRIRKGDPSPVSSVEEFESSVADELHFLPEEFFTKKWSRTDIDTSDGRAMLQEQITKAVQNGGKNIGNMQLFKSSKSDAAS